ncbi:lipoate--protein ligase family protein [Paenibacillus sp. N1-5-1-14]|uniref:lipoate--protein ligase family protein n=1 Tax=Paenibacillus radicibacter TaxID=2972488 RepID=UPI002159ABEA|nr:lipoate--protein ligase family protein [Paenibacillus radicibacter]MCR8644072.1 lipoate--protein ligase family protein [Paenibacillus radicibacter]
MGEIETSLGKVHILDRSQDLSHSDILYPFALEELLCRRVGEGASPIVHIWRHPKAFVMGLKDSRLPNAAVAKGNLERQGYQVAVRNSGGAAVPLDASVVNVTLITPKAQGNIDFRKDFERMYRFIQSALEFWTDGVNKGEVIGSFCPGDFDLSIGDQKFCGIAQRRQTHAIAVQAFVIVEGKGQDKASKARAFYDEATSGVVQSKEEEVVQPTFPLVEENSMISIAEALKLAFTVEQFNTGILHAIHAFTNEEVTPLPQEQLPSEQDVQAMIDQLRKRYDIPSV